VGTPLTWRWRTAKTESFVSALHDAWASPDAIEFKHLALGQHAVILAGEVVGYRLHGSVRPASAL